MTVRKSRLVPVLDVMGGEVVHAVGGLRKEYRPLRSAIVQSTSPHDVAAAMLSATGARELYIADLDAIEGTSPNGDALRQLLAIATVPIWFDGGVGSTRRGDKRQTSPLRPWTLPTNIRPVIGSETCSSAARLQHFLDSANPEAWAFSIDLRNGILLGDWQEWGLEHDRDAVGLCWKVVSLGCRHLIVLDLARVGTGSSCGTQELLKTIRGLFPNLDLMAGGGVKNRQDIVDLGACGVDAVLLASVIHAGNEFRV